MTSRHWSEPTRRFVLHSHSDFTFRLAGRSVWVVRPRASVLTKMKCPYCTAEFPLTWQRYFTARTGRHTCPDCGRISKIPLSASYLGLVILAICVLGVPFAFAFQYWLGGYWMIAGWVVGGSVSGLLIDKSILDAKYNKLVKITSDSEVV